LRSWPSRPDGELRAGVSAFGFGGTNCHVVVSSPPAQAGVLALAASSETGLQEEARRFSRLLDAEHTPDAPVPFADGHRAALCFRSPGELREQLAALGAGNECDGLLRGRTLEARPRIAFVCPPQGAQAIGMARGLLETEPAFLREVTACDESHARFAGWSLLEAFRAEPEHARLGEFEVVQPLLFAVSVGLAAVLREWGVQPDAIIGHSIGEIAAAHLAGVLDRDQAMRVAVQYARALGSCKQPGAMAVAELSAAQAEAWLVGREQRLCIAGYNGPTTTLISGDEAEVRALARELSQSGVFCSIVALAAAAHSPQMATVSLPFEQALHGLAPRRARTALVSTLTATFVQGPELGAAYWPENLREPVRFGEGVQRLIEAGIDAFVELGPHPTLCRQIAVLQQQHEQRPCALGALRRAQNPHDDRRALLSTAAALYVRGAPVDWRRVNRNRGLPRCAARAVAHAAARTHSGASDSGQNDPILVPISARNPTALRELAGAVADRVGDGSIDSLADLARSFARHRDQHEQRLAVVASDVAEFRELVGHFLAGQTRPGLVSGRHAGGAPRTAWVFSGQGSQWVKMGNESYRREPVFRQEFDRCEAALAPFLGSLAAGSLLQSCSLESALDRVELVAPAIFALQVSLAALFRSWGIEPAAVVGHSLGEIAAATVAGAICLEDAAAVVCARSRIAQRTEGQGAMALVELSLAQTREALVGHEALLSVAASNGPRSTVVAGAPHAVAALLRQLEQREVFARLIRVRYASHSPQMEPFLEELRQAVAAVRPSQGHTRFVSTVSGEFQPGTSLDGQYWVRNLRAPVLFSQAIEALAQDGCRTFIELSPHPILVNAIRQNLARDAQRCLALPSLIRNQPERAALLEALGTLYTRGHDIAWSQLARDGEGFVRLPTYRFQRERCWIGDRTGTGSQPIEAATPVGENRSARARLSALASDDRQAWLVDYLTGTFAAVLRLPRSECVSHSPLTALGLDSLTAAEARSQIEAELEQRCPLVWLLRGDITEIAGALAREVPSAAPEAAAYPLAEQRRPDPSSARTSLRSLEPLRASHSHAPLADSQAAGPAAPSPVLPARDAPLGGEPRGTIEALIAQTWRELLGVEQVGRGDDFFRLGGDPSRAQQLRARLFEALDVELSCSSVLAHPTLEGLARQVYLQAESLPRRGASPIVPLRQQRAGRVRLVCFAHAGGGPAMYRPWIKAVSEEIELLAVCLPGRELRLTERPCEDLRAACAEISQALVPLLDRPVAFFGHSFGALLAFETARLLRQQSSLQPARLFLAGFPAADRWRSTASLRAMPGADLPAWLAALGGQSLARSEPEARSLHALLRSDLELLGSHRYSREAPLSCPILAFGGRRDTLASAGDLEAWRSETSGGFALRIFEGDHFFLHPQQAALLEAIAADLQRL
jgi:acyl transferase domain-containing protein/surfactin synthase thioesterase subunit